MEWYLSYRQEMCPFSRTSSFTPFFYSLTYHSTHYYHIHSIHMYIHHSDTFYKLKNSFSIPLCKILISYQLNSLHHVVEQTNPILAQFFLYHIWNKLILLEISILIPILKLLKSIFTHTPNSVFKRRYSSFLSPNPTCFRSSLQRRVFPSSHFLEVPIQLSAGTPSRSILLSNSTQQLQRARPRNQRPIPHKLVNGAKSAKTFSTILCPAIQSKNNFSFTVCSSIGNDRTPVCARCRPNLMPTKFSEYMVVLAIISYPCF